MTYIFVGARAEVPGLPLLDTFGQKVDVAPERIKELVVDQNVSLIPADTFAATSDAPDRMHAARLALHEFRDTLTRETPAEEPTHERI